MYPNRCVCVCIHARNVVIWCAYTLNMSCSAAASSLASVPPGHDNANRCVCVFIYPMSCVYVCKYPNRCVYVCVKPNRCLCVCIHTRNVVMWRISQNAIVPQPLVILPPHHLDKTMRTGVFACACTQIAVFTIAYTPTVMFACVYTHETL